MAKQKLQTQKVDDNGKKKKYFSKRLEGLFKKAKQTSNLTTPPLLGLLQEKEKEKQNREKTPETISAGAGTGTGTGAVEAPNPPKSSSVLEGEREANIHKLDDRITFNFGCDYYPVRGFFGLESELSGSIFDPGHDLAMRWGIGPYFTCPVAGIGGLDYSADFLKLPSRDEMIKAFLKENLFGCN